ncbi:MAG: hypothetical protein WC979_08320 [Candidatus Pacearchaeota archaeon]|jgi:hypothetical protein
MVDYSIDISDDIDKEFPIGQEPSEEFIQKYVNPIHRMDEYTYSNPKSVKMWKHIIQYFLNNLDMSVEDFGQGDFSDATEVVINIIIDDISTQYNIERDIIYINLYKIITEEVEKYMWDIGWKPDFDENKYIKRLPQQPKNMPKYKYREWNPNYINRSYRVVEDKIDEQKAIDWLIKYYSGTTFSINSIADILKTYLFKYMNFKKDQISEFVKSLSDKKPEQFQLFNNNKIHIGAPNTNIEFNNTEPEPEINHDDLINIASSKIEDFKKYGEVKETKDGIYIFIDRGASILAVAHLDTVQDTSHYYTLQQNEEEVIHNAQLDDRLGAYIILDVLPKLGVQADILLTEGEESGNSTARYFTPTKPYKWIFEFDRAGTDTVMYQFEDESSKKLLEDNGLHIGKGSVSDISYMDHLGVKAFNFGTGAYNSHNVDSHAVVPQIKHCIQKFMRFYNNLKDIELPHKFTEKYYRG